MNIAVIGAGISGMAAARLLDRDHAVTVFEAAGWLGGHAHTVMVSMGGNDYSVDAGVMIFNTVTAPLFTRLTEQLGIVARPLSPSLGIRCQRTGLEYGLPGFKHLFAQPRNFFRPWFVRMAREIGRFRRESQSLLLADDPKLLLKDHLIRNGYSEPFFRFFIHPLASALWNANPDPISDLPARDFVAFYKHHGLLDPPRPPRCRAVPGGTGQYAEALMEKTRARVHLQTPVVSIHRSSDFVEVTPQGRPPERFDQVILATHPDQALNLLSDPSPMEQEILSGFGHRESTTLLHFDTSVLPANRRARGHLNFLIPWHETDRAATTYDMNLVQGVEAPIPFHVSRDLQWAAQPGCVLREIPFRHPALPPDRRALQSRKHQINGVDRTWFCGAYWGDGYHEDGLVSALDVCARFGKTLEDFGLISDRMETAPSGI